jgi:P-type Cu2+ transporter
MKTSVMDVGDMLSVLSVTGVEQRIGEVPGVESVTVDFAAAKATVRYDETRLDLADIKSDVRQRGSNDDAPARARVPADHEVHAAPVADKAQAADPMAPKMPASSPADASQGVAPPAKDTADKPGKPVDAP